MMDNSLHSSVHGPYEDAIIAITELVKIIIEGQSPEFRAEMGKRFLEDTKMWHELSVQFGTQLMQGLTK